MHLLSHKTHYQRFDKFPGRNLLALGIFNYITQRVFLIFKEHIKRDWLWAFGRCFFFHLSRPPRRKPTLVCWWRSLQSVEEFIRDDKLEVFTQFLLLGIFSWCRWKAFFCGNPPIILWRQQPHCSPLPRQPANHTTSSTKLMTSHTSVSSDYSTAF